MIRIHALRMATMLVAVVGLTQNANAGCWPVFEGLKSHIECDSAGVTPTFETLKSNINEMAHLSPDCKRSVIRTASSYFQCGMAIVSAIKTGGATVWVGAGEACYTFSEELRDSDRYCTQYVNLRSKPLSARVCNARHEKINVAIARRIPKEKKITSGWWVLQSGECKNFTYSNARVIYAMATTSNGGRIFPDFHNNDLDDNATFCINRVFRHDDLDVETCHNSPHDNPYDYNKPGNLKFTKFGRVSGLTNGFTFH